MADNYCGISANPLLSKSLDMLKGGRELLLNFVIELRLLFVDAVLTAGNVVNCNKVPFVKSVSEMFLASYRMFARSLSLVLYCFDIQHVHVTWS